MLSTADANRGASVSVKSTGWKGWGTWNAGEIPDVRFEAICLPEWCIRQTRHSRPTAPRDSYFRGNKFNFVARLCLVGGLRIVLLQFAIESCFADAQQTRRRQLVAIGFAHGAENRAAFQH